MSCASPRSEVMCMRRVFHCRARRSFFHGHQRIGLHCISRAIREIDARRAIPAG